MQAPRDDEKEWFDMTGVQFLLPVRGEKGRVRGKGYLYFLKPHPNPLPGLLGEGVGTAGLVRL